MEDHIWYFSLFRESDWDKSKGDDTLRDLILEAIGEVQKNLNPERIRFPHGCWHQHKKRDPMFNENKT
jgi:hypothetical protein